ncbi:hypothetical protein BBJ28_00004143 [Nothophytophthora sp. Chile5]|nr:hypothetical protein BBJ28_00004143 [Nothophytophthora sp. Chile5]
MGIQLRKLLRSRVIVVFGATSRIGRSVLEALAAQEQVSVALVAAVENAKDPRVQRLKRATNCYVIQCNFASGGEGSLRRAVRNADAVLLVPALSPSGVRFSKRVIDAVKAEQVARLVVVSSILAFPEVLARCRPGETDETSATEAVGPTQDDVEAVEGCEAVEAHAHTQLPEAGRAVTLRIPVLMETLLYCRDELLFANRFFGCFAEATRVPCIAVRDVGLAAAGVLAYPKRKYEPIYHLAGGPSASCSSQEVARCLGGLLGREITYRKLDDLGFLLLMKEKGAPSQVARGIVGLRVLLEEPVQREEPGEALQQSHDVVAEPRGLPETFHSTGDYRLLTKRELVTPRQWLQRCAALQFARTPQNQTQLFVVGSGEALFLEVSKFVAQQITAPSSLPSREAGEGAIPTAETPGRHGGSSDLQHAKVTLCTVKAAPGTPERARTATVPLPPTVYQVEGAAASPMGNLLQQLSSLDVVLLIPPLRLGTWTCLDVVRTVVHAAVNANAWGIVLVSSLFVGSSASQQSAALEQLEEIESCVKTSGVPHVIVRLPLFMEYFLALSNCDEGENRSSEGFGGVEEEEKCDVLSGTQVEGVETEPTEGSPSSHMTWPLLEPSLASSRVYLMALEDAAKALVATAFTFPLHRGRTRVLFTASPTMQEVQRALQKHAHKARSVRLSRVDALGERPGREFWRIAYWPRAHTQQFLECAVELSKAAKTAEAQAGGEGEHRAMVLPVSQRFKDVTELPPVTLGRWAEANSKCYTRALAALKAGE